LPIAFNWSAVSRRHQPEASLPRRLAEALLLSAPRHAVLFVAGDNDTYPLWFLQQIESLRRDVTVVTIPLLGAGWYGAELSRRYDLVPRAGDSAYASLPAGIAERARQLGRPVVASVALDVRTRLQLGRDWGLSGLVYIERRPAADSATAGTEQASDVDTASTRAWSKRIEQWRSGRKARGSTDSMDDYALGLLSCPRLSLLSRPDSAQTDSLASLCNRR